MSTLHHNTVTTYTGERSGAAVSALRQSLYKSHRHVAPSRWPYNRAKILLYGNKQSRSSPRHGHKVFVETSESTEFVFRAADF